MTATLKDIAREVNRSVTTVSRALHDYNDVSPETREIVKRTALQMGYSPNVAAQRLQKQRADTIGLFVPTFGPQLSDPHFGDILAGVTDEISRAGIDLLISMAAGPDDLEIYRQKIKGRQLDSVLVVRTLCRDPRIDFLRQHQMPFVANGRVLDDCDFTCIDVNYEAGVQALVGHLKDLGHERISFVSGSPALSFVHFQLQGFRQGMGGLDLVIDEDMVIETELTQKGGYRAAHVLLSQERPPTAIITSNDLMAFGVMSAAQDHGLEVGQDIAVAGFDDIPAAETSHPTLTTVRQPAQHLGRLLGKMLISTARDENLSQSSLILEPSLVIRQSTNLDLWL